MLTTVVGLGEELNGGHACNRTAERSVGNLFTVNKDVEFIALCGSLLLNAKVYPSLVGNANLIGRAAHLKDISALA